MRIKPSPAFKLVGALLLLPLIGRAQLPGTLDSSFATNGVLVLPGIPPVVDIAVEASGRMIAAAQNSTVAKLIGVTPSGSVDSTFGESGIVDLPPGLTVRSVLVGSDDAVFAVTSRDIDTSIVVLKLNESGQVDSSFGVSGWAFLNHQFEVIGAALHDDQAINMAGEKTVTLPGPGNAQLRHAALCRITTSGQLDSDFGSNGFAIDIGAGTNETFSIGGISFVGDAIWYGYGLTSQGTTTVFYQGLMKKYSLQGEALHTRLLGSTVGNASAALHDFTFGTDSSRCFVFEMRNFDSARSIEVYNNTTAWSVFDEIPVDNGVRARCARNSDDQVLLCVGPRIYRLTEDAMGIDLAWGATGEGFTSEPTQSHRWLSVGSDSTGHLLAGGYSSAAPTYYNFMLARFHDVVLPATSLSLHMNLGGAYDADTGLMRDSLRAHGLLPHWSPYQAPVFVPVNGVGPSTIANSLFGQNGEDAVVDWVWLELLSATDSATVMATRAGILRRSGRVTGANGAPIDFGIPAGNYFVRVLHRNHLGVTCSIPLALSSTLTTLDLSDPAVPTFGTDAQMEIEGVRMLWPGDVTGDGVVKYVGPGNDRDPILVRIGGNTPTAIISGYHPEDVNLDGRVKYVGTANDRDLILQTIGGNEVLGTREEQRP